MNTITELSLPEFVKAVKAGVKDYFEEHDIKGAIQDAIREMLAVPVTPAQEIKTVEMVTVKELSSLFNTDINNIHYYLKKGKVPFTQVKRINYYNKQIAVSIFRKMGWAQHG